MTHLFPRPSFPVLSILACAALASPALAGSQEEMSQAMNLLLRAADNNSGVGLTASDCASLHELASGVGSAQTRFSRQAAELFAHACARKGDANKATEDDPNSEPNNAPVSDADALWDGEALCPVGHERILECEHNGKNGRGMFVYSGSDSPVNSPTLVCAQFEATFRSLFEFGQEIDSRCVVTEFDWRYEAQRSDVYGMKTWLESEVSRAPLGIPAALKDQCQKVFSDALYCTPTVIILPEKDPSSLSICQLKTFDHVFGFGPFLHIGSSNSSWTCKSKSLLIPNRDERLSVEELSCVPDDLGQLMNPYCRFPYMPVAREPVRTFIPQD
ncbi:hypothetical protein EBU99_09735 [bacterium]|nr:hypothetical protein [bacterium]